MSAISSFAILLNEDILLEKISTLSKASLKIIFDFLEPLSPGIYLFEEKETRSNNIPDALLIGIKVLPPDVNTGEANYFIVTENFGGFETFPLEIVDLYDQTFIHGQLALMKKSDLMF